MTQVRSISHLYMPNGTFDGFRVVTSIGSSDGSDRILELRRSSLPGNVRNGSAADIETYVNDWMAQQLAGIPTQCRIHVRSANPLHAEAVCSTRLIPDGWWVSEEG